MKEKREKRKEKSENFLREVENLMLESLHDKGKFIQCAVGIRIDKMMNGTE